MLLELKPCRSHPNTQRWPPWVVTQRATAGQPPEEQMMWYVGRFGKDWGGEQKLLFLLVHYFGKDGREIYLGKLFSETM